MPTQRRSALMYDVWVTMQIPEGSDRAHFATMTRYAGGRWRGAGTADFRLPLTEQQLRDICDSVDEVLRALIVANLGVSLELRAELAPPVADVDTTTR